MAFPQAEGKNVVPRRDALFSFWLTYPQHTALVSSATKSWCFSQRAKQASRMLGYQCYFSLFMVGFKNLDAIESISFILSERKLECKGEGNLPKVTIQIGAIARNRGHFLSKGK